MISEEFDKDRQDPWSNLIQETFDYFSQERETVMRALYGYQPSLEHIAATRPMPRVPVRFEAHIVNHIGKQDDGIVNFYPDTLYMTGGGNRGRSITTNIF